MTAPGRLYYKIFRCARRSRRTDRAGRVSAGSLAAAFGRRGPRSAVGVSGDSPRSLSGLSWAILRPSRVVCFPCSEDPARLVGQACPAVLAGSRACQSARTRDPVCPRFLPRGKGRSGRFGVFSCVARDMWTSCCVVEGFEYSISGARCKACLTQPAKATLRVEIRQTCLGPLVSGALRLCALIAA